MTLQELQNEISQDQSSTCKCRTCRDHNRWAAALAEITGIPLVSQAAEAGSAGSVEAQQPGGGQEGRGKVREGWVNINDTESIVIHDILQRQAKGVSKYGTTVANNPLTLRQWLQHAYEESLDQAIYLKRAIEEIEKEETK